MTIVLREGWTERIECDLFNNGAAYVLTGMTVSLEGEDATGAEVSIETPKVGIVDAATGRVFVDLDATDLKFEKSPYQLRFKVADTFGRVGFFPRIGSVTWEIQKP